MGSRDAPIGEAIDPAVAELVATIRDRFGLRGMRDAQVMLADEVVLAEQAMAELDVGLDSGPDVGDEPATGGERPVSG